MDIKTLESELYEDLNGRIELLESGERVVIKLTCDDWEDKLRERERTFLITCIDSVESTVTERPNAEIELLSNHPVLWKHNAPYGELFYNSATAAKYELIGRLWEANEKATLGWREFSQYLNTFTQGEDIKFCEGNGGLVARGPTPLLDKFQSAIAGLVETNLVPTYQPEGGFKALVFDDCFVVCKEIEVEELVRVE